MTGNWPAAAVACVGFVSVASAFIGEWPILFSWVKAEGAGAMATGGDAVKEAEHEE